MDIHVCVNVFTGTYLTCCLNVLLQKSFKREEKDADGQLDFEEFVHYLQDYEKDLKLVVKSLDKKDAGKRIKMSFV